MQRLTLALAAASVVAAHGPAKEMPKAAPATGASNYSPAPAGLKCKYIPGDKEFPTEEVWKKAFPGVKARGVKTKTSSPDYRLEVTTVQQVKDAVNFARTNNVRLSMIASGHDGLGRNNAATGLILGLENLKGLRVEDTWTPTAEGAAPVVNPKAGKAVSSSMEGMAGMAGMSMHKRHGPDGDDDDKPATNATSMAGMVMRRAGKLPVAVTIGAGLSTQEINDKIAELNIFTNGAEHGEVGVAGGWSQCGGHGPMSSAYGLGADDVLEYQVVTPDGQLKIANAVANPDLFWALRGGCGGTYGIVVQSTIKAFPSTKMTLAKFTIMANDDSAIYEPTAWLHTKFVELSKKGIQGYYLVFPKMLIGYFHTVGTLATDDFNNKTWTPLVEKLTAYPNIDKAKSSITYQTFNSYKAYYDGTWGPSESDEEKRKVKRNNWWWGNEDKVEQLTKRGLMNTASSTPKAMPKEKGGSRLLDEAALSHPDLAKAMKAGMPTGPGAMLRGGLIGGMGVQRVAPDATSVHPSWRKAYVTLWVGGNSQPLIDIAKGMGAYVNEGSYNESSWKETFWGSNYARLSEIKAKTDPEFVFYVTPGINADHMTADAAGRLCMVPEAKIAGVNSAYPPIGDNLNYA